MKKFENYPWWIIVTTSVFQLAVYVIGGSIIFRYGLIWLILYLVYISILEVTFYPKSCVYCYYYGKWCAFGKGKVAGLFFKKKDPNFFCKRKASFLKMLPELLVVLVPVVLGIILLIRHFEIWIFLLLILDIILTSFGNGWIRGKLACPGCKQGEICCPAREIFSKNIVK